MNFFKKIINGLKKVFGAAKTFYVRAGLGKFLDQYIPVALSVIASLQKVNDNKGFHEWKDQAFIELKKIAGNVADTWIVIVLNMAYELSKAEATKPENKEKI